jgi:APA family basic amino acid/polyamine antiporter
VSVIQRSVMSDTGLRRELTKWDLTALGVNQVLGGAVFLMPALVFAQLGNWSIFAVAGVGVLAMCVALCFAEAGSRFEGTGGAALYVHHAFGSFAGFEVGWMLWVVRITSWASVINGLADSLGYYWPVLRAGTPRTALITGVILVLMSINIRGIRQSAWVVNTLTVGKLVPLALFILLGLPHVAWGSLAPGESLLSHPISAPMLYLIFAYGGYEVVPVPAGEAKDPRRAVPFAMIMTIVITGLIMTLAQAVAVGTLPGIAASKTPLADAALRFMGGWGALLITIGATVSTTGNNMGSALSGSRSLFGLAEQGDLPKVFGWLHPTYRTPVVAIMLTSVLTLVLALSGTFASMATVSAIARLVVYVGTAAAVLVLRRKGPAGFTIPGGPIVPLVALGVCVSILAGATPVQRQSGAIALLVGAVLYFLARTGRPGGSMRGARTLIGLTLVAATALTMTLIPALASAQTMVILTRHAERADGAATMSAPGQAPVDPPLSAAGEARAQKLATMLADAGITVVFTTEFRRTKDTAAPLAAKLALTPEVVAASKAADLIAKITAKPNDIVFVVGHSNTVPGMITALGGPLVTIADNEYDNLFLYVPATKTLTRIRY